MLLIASEQQTLGVAGASLEKAWASKKSEAADDDAWCVETLGLHESEKERLGEQLRDPSRPIDPAARFLVGATNGLMYRHLIGQGESYPIPEFRLGKGSGRTLLDIGCNWGRWCIAASRQGYRPIGIDPSLGAVLAARRICADLKIDAEFVVGDARFLPFPEGTFDAVYSYSVIQHFSKEDARGAFAEAVRVAKPDGAVLIQMPNKFGLRCLYHQARRRFREARAFEVRYWGLGELRRMAKNTGTVATFTVDCFFGLGLQASDIPLMSPFGAALIRASELLRGWSRHLPWLKLLADSVYVRLEKPRVDRESSL